MSREGVEKELDDTDDWMAEDICAGCGIESSEWQGNQGKGFMKNDQLYCCRDCAEDIECNCQLQNTS
jgi:hypothetical protein